MRFLIVIKAHVTQKTSYFIMKCFLFFGLTSTLLACKTESNKVLKFTLEEGESGIVHEKFDSTVVDNNKYNNDNIVFKVGTTFKYDFQHITPEGKLKYFKVNDSNRTWEFVDEDETDDKTISAVIIEVLDGNPMGDGIPGYNQTNLKYVLRSMSNYSISGVIENEANTWMHPPRDYYFRILELNPFPYIKSPFITGTSWTWKLKIGDGWGDERWKLWEGSIENTYSYSITDEQIIETSMGELKCFVVTSEAESRIGKTGLTAFYNPEYGFIKLDYLNIDGSKTVLKLVEKI